jgi:hypothetical protein
MDEHSAATSVLRRAEIFTPLEVAEAPDSIGLYAWYGSIGAGPNDWTLRIGTDGEDAGEVACSLHVQAQTDSHVRPPIILSGQTTFSERWAGEIRSDRREKGEAGAPLHQVLQAASKRKLLLDLLEDTAPVLWAPLYIGIAVDQSLRERLGQHVKDLLKWHNRVSKKPEIRDRLQQKPKNFAIRAIAAGFGPARLRVWTFDVGGAYEGYDDDSKRDVIRAAEGLLNQWHRPILGER